MAVFSSIRISHNHKCVELAKIHLIVFFISYTRKFNESFKYIWRSWISIFYHYTDLEKMHAYIMQYWQERVTVVSMTERFGDKSFHLWQ